MRPLDRFEALTFDCYGTLIDWETGILSALRPLVSARGGVADDDRLLALYAAAEAAEEAAVYRPYKVVLRGVLERIAFELGIALEEDERDALSRSLPGWPPFADTTAALARLAGRFRLGILSNIDRDLFAGTRARLGEHFTWVVTAEDAGAYKPSMRMFETAQSVLGVPKERWLHVGQSRFHDVAPATAFGLATVHVDRRHHRAGHGDGASGAHAKGARATWTVPDLKSLAELAVGASRT